MNKALFLLAPVLLAGCNLAPRHELPPLPTAPAYPETTPQGAVRAADISWPDFFPDPRLRTLITLALDQNRDRAVALAQIEAAQAAYRIERSARLPSVTAQAGASSADTLGIQSDQFNVGVGVTSFELDLWGRVRNLSAAARARYLATSEAEEAFTLSLVREVAVTHFRMSALDEQIALAEATVQSRREGLRISLQRLNAGVTSALDFRQSEALLTQAETQLADMKLNRARSLNYLIVLVGGKLPADLPAALSFDKQRGADKLEPGLPSDLLLNRPDVRQAEQELIAARADIGAARAAFLPSISLTGAFGFASDSLNNLLGSDNQTWNYGGGAVLPIFDFGRRVAARDAALAGEKIMLASYEGSIQQAFREVADALAGRRLLAEQAAAQSRAATAQREIARLAQIRYREGVSNYLEVLDAERNLFAVEQALIELRRSQLENHVTLYVALGGGADLHPPAGSRP